jgi:preprotein translocase subunit SecG
MDLKSLLLEAMYDQWQAQTFSIIKNIVLVLIAICAIVVIVSVLFQHSNDNGGTNSITGVTESYYSENKTESREGRLKRVTVVCSSAVAVLTIVYLIINLFVYNA